MKRIVRIITRLNVGGPAIQAIELTRRMHHEFHNVLISGTLEKQETDMRYFAEGIPIHYCKHMKREIRPKKDAFAYGWLTYTLPDFAPDIIHTHTAKAGLLGRLAGLKSTNAKLVHTFHGNSLSGYFNPVKNVIFRMIERQMAKRTDAIIAISNSQKWDLVNKYKIAAEDKVHVIPLGFDLKPFYEITPPPKWGRGQALNIGIIGRLEPIKNHDLFIELARRLGIRHNYFVIGAGRREQELKRKVAKLGVRGESITFMGEFGYKQMPEVYKMLDIVVLTSHNEGTPVTLIEAMASSRPVVATAVGGVRDLVEGRGYLCKPGYVPDLVNGVLAMKGCPEHRDKCIAAAWEHVVNKYSIERLIRDLENLYERILS